MASKSDKYNRADYIFRIVMLVYTTTYTDLCKECAAQTIQAKISNGV